MLNYKKQECHFGISFFRTEELSTVTTYTQNGITNQNCGINRTT